MGLVVVTPAASLCVTLAEFRAHLEEAAGAPDALLTQALTDATEWVEGRTNLQLMTATWLQTWDEFPGGPLKLDLQPVASISHVKHYDADGTLTTLSSTTDYWSGLRSRPPKIVPQDGWPDIQAGRPEAVQVQFVAGYASAALVPGLAKRAVKMLAGFWFIQQTAVTVAESTEPEATTPAYGEIPFGVESLCELLQAGGYT